MTDEQNFAACVGKILYSTSHMVLKSYVQGFESKVLRVGVGVGC